MIILRDPQQLSQVVQPDIKAFLRQRFHAIGDPDPYNPDVHGYFIVLEPGDTAEQIEAATGYAPLKSLFDDSVYGDADFAPDFECLEDQGRFFEIVYILTDSGFTVVFIVPKEQGIDSRMLGLCAEFATPTPPLAPDIAAVLSRLDETMREFYQERAAIAEFEAGMSRAEAEQFALALTCAHFKLAPL